MRSFLSFLWTMAFEIKYMDIQNRVAHFSFMAAIGEISYSLIDNNGKEINQGQKLVDPTHFFIDIPDEQK